MANEEFQQAELFTGEHNAVSGATDFSGYEINREVSHLKLAFRDHRVSPPQKGSHPGEQFGKRKGFNQIIVRTQFQSFDPVFDRAEGCQQ
ncbi:Uncharacterised protein [Klebsiella pneumoniae]|nr:Uncharacterised protein [Klebsiella pneumoniae]